MKRRIKLTRGKRNRRGQPAACLRGSSILPLVVAALAASSEAVAEGPPAPEFNPPTEYGPQQAQASAQRTQAEQAQPIRFDVPPQPLGAALAAFANQAGLELVFTAEQVAGKEAEGLSGTYSPAAGLQRLLAGSGLRYRFVNAETVALEGGVALVAGKVKNLGPVVVSATRTETPISELTRSVTVVTKKDIEQQKRIDRNLGDMLSQTVPGFSQSTEALSNFGQTLRGRDFLTLIDGIPQTTPLRGGARSLNSIDADAIERVEVVRGGSAVYGFGAAGGLVNIITRRPEEGALNGHSEAGLKFSTTHPDDSLEWHTNHRVSGRTNEVDYLLSGTFVQRNGFFDADGDRIPANPVGGQGGLADTDEYNVLGKLGYEFDGGNQRIEASFNRFSILQDSNWAGLGFGDPATNQKTPAVRGNINAKNPGTKNTTANVEYHNKDLLGSDVKTQLYYGDLTTRFPKFPGFSQTEINSEKYGARLTVDTPVQLAPVPFNAIWGVDYLHDETEQPGLDGPTTTPEMRQNAIAGFLQLDVPVADWGLVRGGVRHESISVDVDDVLNRQGVFVNGGNLDFNKTLFNLSGTVFLTDNIELFGGFSQGFSLGDIGRAIRDTTGSEARELQSAVQKVDNYEVGLRGHYGRWDGSVTGFFSKSDTGTTFSPDLFIAKQPERVYGVELTANVQPIDPVRIGGTATWLAGTTDLDNDGDYEEDLPSTRVPPVKITAYTEYTPFPWWTTRLQGLYSGNRHPDSTQFGNGDVNDYIVFDLYSNFDLSIDRLQLGKVQVGVGNLFNEDYFPVVNQAGALPFAFSQAPGRTVSVTYSYNW